MFNNNFFAVTATLTGSACLIKGRSVQGLYRSFRNLALAQVFRFNEKFDVILKQLVLALGSFTDVKRNAGLCKHIV